MTVSVLKDFEEFIIKTTDVAEDWATHTVGSLLKNQENITNKN